MGALAGQPHLEPGTDLRKGYRKRFATYVPPVMKKLGFAEVEDQPRNNRMLAVWRTRALYLSRGYVRSSG